MLETLKTTIQKPVLSIRQQHAGNDPRGARHILGTVLGAVCGVRETPPREVEATLS